MQELSFGDNESAVAVGPEGHNLEGSSTRRRQETSKPKMRRCVCFFSRELAHP